MQEQIDVVNNLIQAISILNKTDEYLESLASKLSECDSLISDYEHFIEYTPIEDVDLKKLYSNMRDNFLKRRTIKNDMALRDNYKNLVSRLNNSINREFLIQSMKNAKEKLNTRYRNRVLTDDLIKELMIDNTTQKRRGRPPKNMKDEVIKNV